MKTQQYIYTLLIGTMLCLTSVQAQQYNLSAGVHGGSNLWLNDGNVKPTIGANAGLDLAFAYRWSVGRNTTLGPLLGISGSFVHSGFQMRNFEDRYSNIDYYKERMNYTITCDRITETSNSVQIEVPIMLSLQTNQWVVNLGARLAMPLYSQRKQSIKDADITAYYPDFEVPVHNKLITGLAGEDILLQKGDAHLPKYNISAVLEFGYEWNISRQQVFGLMLYADYNVWNNYRNDNQFSYLIEVNPILNPENPVPSVQAHYLTDCYVHKMNNLSVGLKLYVALQGKNRSRLPYHYHSSSSGCRCL